jgi:hypothetical protein
MSKLLFALAFAIVLVSGAFMNVHAANSTGPYFSQPACWSFACGINNTQAKQLLHTPVQMGAVGF